MDNVVMKIGKLNLKGNVIDNGWFAALTHESGKPNLVAIILLSEIVYWYKPTEVRNEETGAFLGYKKKFKADKFQRSYSAFAQQFGFSKKQVKDACNFLKDKQLITIELRTIEVNGQKYNNVMYIEPVPENIEKISGFNKQYIKAKNHESGLKSSQVYPYIHRSTQGGLKSMEGCTSMYPPPYMKVGTNTENTTKSIYNYNKEEKEKKSNSGTDAVHPKELIKTSESSSGTDAVQNKEPQQDNKQAIENDDEASKILKYYCQKTNTPDVNVTGRDTGFAIELANENVPFEIVKQGIDLSLERYRPKFQGDKIRGLTYCRYCIKEILENKRIIRKAATKSKAGESIGNECRTIRFDKKHKQNNKQNNSGTKYTAKSISIPNLDTEHPEKYGIE